MPLRDPERPWLVRALRAIGMVLATIVLLAAFAVAVAALTRADATEDYPIPQRAAHDVHR